MTHQIADDFVTYSNGDDHARRQELYRYRQVTEDGTGKEIFLPLDFDEIKTLHVVVDGRTREVNASRP